MPVLEQRSEGAWLVPLRTPQRVADALVEVLVEAGVRVVFGIPGGTIAPLLDALLDRPEVKVVTTTHEAGAMFAAAAYARSSGTIGVVAVTSGPGVLNTMTGLASARCDGVPVLVLAGEVARRVQGRGALQDGSAHDLDIVGMMTRVTKLAAELPAGSAGPIMLRRAIAVALSGRRGPVGLTLPMDLTSAATHGASLSLGLPAEVGIDPEVMIRVATALGHGRAVIFAGSGVRWDDGPPRLLELAEHAQIPVMTTPKGKGVFPESHPLSLGVFGLGGHPSAQAYLDGGVDTLLAVGTSLGELATNGWSESLAARHAFIQVDVDPAAMSRNYALDIAVAAPAGRFLRELRPLLRREPVSVLPELRSFALNATRTPGRVAPHLALAEIQRALPGDTIYCVDAGEHSLFAAHFLRIDRPDSFISMSGLGAMGSSLGGAIGAQLAQPDRTVAVICGDGGYALAGSELATAAAEGLPLRVFVFNDQRLGMVEVGMNALYGRTPAYPVGPFDVVQHAVALGAVALGVRSLDEMSVLHELSLAVPGPLVVDVQVDPAFRMPKNKRFDDLAATAKRRSD